MHKSFAPMPRLALWSCLTLACAKPTGSPPASPTDPTTLTYVAEDARARGAAGCYRLSAGPPVYSRQALLGDSLERAALPRSEYRPSVWNLQEIFPLPRVVELRPQRSEVPVNGHYALLPQPDSGTGYRYSSWGGSRDTLRLEWTMRDGGFSPILIALLIRRDTIWEGQARLYSDDRSLQERFYRPVSARRVTCSKAGP